MDKPVPWDNPEVNETPALKNKIAKAPLGLMYHVIEKPLEVTAQRIIRRFNVLYTIFCQGLTPPVVHLDPVVDFKGVAVWLSTNDLGTVFLKAIFNMEADVGQTAQLLVVNLNSERPMQR